jgi:hypothetical protein
MLMSAIRPLENNGLPAWMKAAKEFGAWAVLASFLIWSIVQNLTGTQAATKALLEEHTTITNHYLYIICVNLANTDPERALCREPEKGR